MFKALGRSSSAQLIYLYAQILILSVVCFLLLLGHSKIPKQVDTLFPKGTENTWLFSDGDSNVGGSRARWIDKSQNKFECHVTHKIQWPYCGFESQLTEDYSGLDLSEYELIKVYINYEGPSTEVGITLRTFEPSAYIEDNLDSLKYSVVPLDTVEIIDGENAIEIQPKEWQVLHWWLDRYKISRQDRYPNFDGVVMVGLNLSDQPNDGDHLMQLKRIEMIKNQIPEKTWYMFVISSWLFLVFVIVSWHLINVIRQSKKYSSKAKALSIYAGELAQISQQHKEEAMRDDLTQLNNRKGMSEYLNSMLARNESFDLSLILFDLDLFKKINDTYGHDVGDQVLIEVSQIIAMNIRKSDCFCRWGGEEFAILCPSMPEEKARIFANKLCQLIASLEIKLAEGTINVSASFGVSSGQIDKNNLLDNVFERADSALYKAKENGRNCVM